MNKKWSRKIMMADVLVLVLLATPLVYGVATEAPAGFDNLTNGFTTQAQFDLDLATFDEFELIDDGLGPVYNAQACRECHQNPVSGATSQITELRVARNDPFGNYSDRPGGSLINDRAINAAIQERLTTASNTVDTRSSLNILGDGFVEAIADTTLLSIQAGQSSTVRGTTVSVAIVESPGTTRIGRFGWKDQHASLLSFAADAYLNEMGITSPLQPTENSSVGNSVAAFDTVADPEDTGTDIQLFADFMRSLKAPSRDTALAATASAQTGLSLFNSIGCATCHVATINTAPAGSVINGGAFTVPAALGDKAIHPFGDFLLHDVGTGDGIVQNGGQSTRNKVRTMPLWGMRARDRLMHDGASVSRTDAILRHRNEAAGAANNFAALSLTQQNNIIDFLNSL